MPKTLTVLTVMLLSLNALSAPQTDDAAQTESQAKTATPETSETPKTESDPSQPDQKAAETTRSTSVPNAPQKEASGQAQGVAQDTTIKAPEPVVAHRFAPPPPPPIEPEPEAPEPRPHVTATYTPGKGLAVHSLDGRFKVNTKLFGQVLYTFVNDNDGHNSQSLQIRRARLLFSGFAFGEHNKYFVQLAFSPKDMQWQDGAPTKSPVFDWYFTFDHLRDLTFQIGQYRVPYSRQRRIPISKLQFIDRTLANFEFNLDRDIGFHFSSKDLFGLGLLRYYAGVFIGEGRDGYAETDTNFLYNARIEILPLGLFDDYLEADLERRKTPALSIGAAYAFLDEAKGDQGILGSMPIDGGTTDMHNLTADLMFKIAGVSILGEFFWRDGQRKEQSFGDVQILESEVAQTAPRDGIGYFAQAGWVVPKIPLEIVARYSALRHLKKSSTLDDGDEIGAGIAYYIFGPALKVSADYHHTWYLGELDEANDQVRLEFQAGF